MRTREQSIAAHRGTSPRKIAARWGCSPETVLQRIADGSLRAINVARPGAKKPRWAVLQEDLLAYEDRHGNRKPAGEAA